MSDLKAMIGENTPKSAIQALAWLSILIFICLALFIVYVLSTGRYVEIAGMGFGTPADQKITVYVKKELEEHAAILEQLKKEIVTAKTNLKLLSEQKANPGPMGPTGLKGDPGARGPSGRDGKSVTIEDLRPLIHETVLNVVMPKSENSKKQIASDIVKKEGSFIVNSNSTKSILDKRLMVSVLSSSYTRGCEVSVRTHASPPNKYKLMVGEDAKIAISGISVSLLLKSIRYDGCVFEII